MQPSIPFSPVFARFFIRKSALLLIPAVLGFEALSAAPAYWEGGVSTDWSNADNWSQFDPLPFGSVPGLADAAIFDSASNNDPTPLGGNQSIGQLLFEDFSTAKILGDDVNAANVLTIGGLSSLGLRLDPTTNFNSADVTINFNLILSAAQRWENLSDKVITAAANVTLGANLTLTDDNNVNTAFNPGGSFVIGSTGKALINSGASRTLEVQNMGSATELTINSTIQLSESATTGRTFTLNIAENASVDVNGNIVQFSSGAGNFTKTGLGNLNLYGNLNYSGTTNMNGGGAVLVQGAVNTGAGAWNINNGTAVTVTGNITSTGAWTVNNASTVNLNTNTVSMGALTIDSGVVNVNAASGSTVAIAGITLGSTGTPTSALLNFNDGLTLSLGGNISARNGTADFLIDVDTLQLNASRDVAVAQGNTLEITSNINNGTAVGATSRINKTGAGTLILTGTNSTSGTNNAMSKGILILDYTTNNTQKLSNEDLNIYDGTIRLIGNASGPTTQTIKNLNVATTSASAIPPGVTYVRLEPGGGQPLTLAVTTITRGAAPGGTVNFVLPANTSVTTTMANTNLIGGWATIDNGNDYFAAVANNQVVALTPTDNDDVTRQWSPTLVNKDVSDVSGFTGTSDYMSINSLRFGSAGSLSVQESLHIESGGLLVARTSTSAGILGGTLTVGALNDLIVTQNSTTDFEISSNIRRYNNVVAGPVNITKSGVGELILSGNNATGTASTPATISGIVGINEGTVTVRGGKAISDNTEVAISGTTASGLRLESSETIASLRGTNSLGLVEMGANNLTINQAADATYSGSITGSGTIVKNNLNPLSAIAGLTFNTNNNDSFTGNMVVNAGAVVLAGSGVRNFNSINTITVNQTGMLLIDNNGAFSNGADPYTTTSRINDNASLVLNGANGRLTAGGAIAGLSMRTNTASSGTHGEVVRNLTFNNGANYVLIETSAEATLIRVTNEISRQNGSTLSIRGTNLAAASGSRTRLQMGSGPTVNGAAFANQFRAGGIYANGATPLATSAVSNNSAAGAKDISIVSWAIGENLAGNGAAGSTGNTFVAFQNDNLGFRALNLSTEYAAYADASSGNGNNTRASMLASLDVGAGKTVNSLLLNNENNAATSVTFSGTGTLTNTSGAFLFTSVGVANASTGRASYNTTQGGIVVQGFDGIAVGGTNPEYIMFVTNTSTQGVTINSALTSAAALTKSGLGILKLTGNNSTVTDVTINEGTLEISNLNTIGGSTGALRMAGGTLRLSNISGDVYDGAANSLATRAISMQEGTTSRLNTNGISVTAGAFAAGTGTFIKAGIGTLTLTGTGPSLHTGLTIVEAQGTTAQTVPQLLLNNANGVAIAGDLQIGNLDAANQAGSAVVYLGRSEQIADTAVLTVTGRTGNTSFFTLMGYSETVAGIKDSSANGVIQVSQSINLGANNLSTLTLAGNDDYFFNGIMRDGAAGNTGILSITKTGTGTQTFSGDRINYTGTTTVSGGLLLMNDTTIFNSAIVNNATVEIERTNSATWTYAKAISGNGSVRKTGVGIGATIFDAANTYTGTTDVDAGRLSLGASGSINNSRATNIKAGAVFDITAKAAGGYNYGGYLSGGGTVAGNITLVNGNLRTGASSGPAVNATTGDQLGTLTIVAGGSAAGNFGLNASNALLQIGRATTNDAGITTAYENNTLAAYLAGQASTWNALSVTDADGLSYHDSMNIQGSFTWSDGGLITYQAVDGYVPAAGDVYDLWDWTGVATFTGVSTGADGNNQRIGGTLGNLELPELQGGLFYDLSQFQQYGIIVVAGVVPEPSRALLLMLGAGLLLMRRRRRVG